MNKKVSTGAQLYRPMEVSSVAKADVRPLHTLVVNCEQSEAQELLLVDLLGRDHCLLVIDNAAGFCIAHGYCCDIRVILRDGLAGVLLLEPSNLFLGKELPDRHPLRVMS